VKYTGSFRLALTAGGCSILVASVFTIWVVPRLALLALGKEEPQTGTAVAGAKT